MINLTTVTMQLIDSKPDGIKICRVEGESLVTVVVPREKLAEAKNLPDLPARGVYFLLDEDHGMLNKVYAGRYDAGTGRFVVLAGSEVALNRSILKNQGAVDARRNMFGCAEGADKAVSTDDLEFASPSTAAQFVLGGSQNGWTEWVSEDGKTLNDVYRTESQHNE